MYCKLWYLFGMRGCRSLGCSVVEMLTGSVPFKGSTATDIVIKLFKKEFQSMYELPGETSKLASDIWSCASSQIPSIDQPQFSSWLTNLYRLFDSFYKFGLRNSSIEKKETWKIIYCPFSCVSNHMKNYF